MQFGQERPGFSCRRAKLHSSANTRPIVGSRAAPTRLAEIEERRGGETGEGATITRIDGPWPDAISLVALTGG
jgi:hypothetical protein